MTQAYEETCLEKVALYTSLSPRRLGSDGESSASPKEVQQKEIGRSTMSWHACRVTALWRRRPMSQLPAFCAGCDMQRGKVVVIGKALHFQLKRNKLLSGLERALSILTSCRTYSSFVLGNDIFPSIRRAFQPTILRAHAPTAQNLCKVYERPPPSTAPGRRKPYLPLPRMY